MTKHIVAFFQHLMLLIYLTIFLLAVACETCVIYAAFATL